MERTVALPRLTHSITFLCASCVDRMTYMNAPTVSPITEERAVTFAKRDGWVFPEDGGPPICRWCDIMARAKQAIDGLPDDSAEKKLLTFPLTEWSGVGRALEAGEKREPERGTFIIYRMGKRIPVPATVLRRAGKQILIEYHNDLFPGQMRRQWLRRDADLARFTPDTVEVQAQ